MTRFWDGPELPKDLVTQKLAFVGRSGSGKSYAASVLAELLLDRGEQVCVLDWIGNWFGLRLDRAGKKPSGLPIYIFGGEYGDVPLEAEGGELAADVLVDHRASAILDISEWSKTKRSGFATAFAERLLLKKRREKSPLHLIIEEAQAYAPQRAAKGSERMLGAFEELIKVGRNRGIGVSILTQRPQAVHKDVLNQTELLLSFQLNAAHERAAIKAWVDEHGADVRLLDEMSKLQPGHAIAWSPSWLKFFGRVAIAKRATFDATRTPEMGDRQVKEIAPLDLGALKEAMAATIARRTVADPKKVKRLEEKIAALTANYEDVSVLREELAEAHREIERHAGENKRLGAFVAAMIGLEHDLQHANELLCTALDEVRRVQTKTHEMIDNLSGMPMSEGSGGAGSGVTVIRGPTLGNGKDHRKRKPDVEADLGRPAVKLLRALAGIHPTKLPRIVLAMHASISPRSSSLSEGLSDLRSHGYLDDAGGTFGLTADGLEAGSAWRGHRPASPEELRAWWAGKLKGPALKMFSALSEVGGLDRDHLIELAGISPTSSGVSEGLAALRMYELLDEDKGLFQLRAELRR